MPDRPDVFISYSRADRAFVEQQLWRPLSELGKDVWIDLEDIAPTADWRRAIWAGIDAAKAVVFVLTPESLASPVCAQELDRARAANKRLIVVVRREPRADTPVPDDLGRPNWIWFRESDDLAHALDLLVAALETDLAWRDAHARLVVRAREWVREDRDRSFLLRGSDLRAAELWLTEQHGHAETATQEQTQYILASRQASARRQRITLAAVGAALAVAIVLAGVARHQADLAEERAKVAGSRELAASALANVDADPELAMLLALEAGRVSDTDGAAQALRRAVVASQWRVASHFDTGEVEHVEFSPDGARVTAASGPEVQVRATDGTGAVRVLRHPATVNDVAFSGDGSRLVTASDDGVRVWNAASGRRLAVIGRGEAVEGAAFGRDARTVLTAAGDRLAVWRLPRADRPWREVQIRAGSAKRIAFSHDGEVVLAEHGSGAALVATATGRATPLRGFEGELSNAELSRDDRRLVIVSGRAIGVWSRAGEPVRMTAPRRRDRARGVQRPPLARRGARDHGRRRRPRARVRRAHWRPARAGPRRPCAVRRRPER